MKEAFTEAGLCVLDEVTEGRIEGSERIDERSSERSSEECEESRLRSE